MTWDAPTIARLLDRYANRMPTSAIASQLGTTRNAVIGKVNRLRAEQVPAMIEADAKRGPRINRTNQVAEWMAEHGGRVCDCARALGIGQDSTLRAWQRVCRDMGEVA